MSGHSKWASIKHKKAAVDKARGKPWAKLVRNIKIAAREGGGDVNGNATLRTMVQKAKAEQVPNDKIENAIKRAMGNSAENYTEILYEGYGPHGVAILVETATDNHVRTVANVKSHFNKGGGALGNSGSVAFQFKKMGVFKLKPEGLSADELELELIDNGLEEMGEGTGENGETV
mgnify:CR=1 FL=1